MRFSCLSLFFLLSQLGVMAQVGPLADKALQQTEGEAVTLGEAVNSKWPETHPVLSPDGRSLFFSRLQHPQNMEMDEGADVWMSRRQLNGEWTRAINVGGPINDRSSAGIWAAGPAAGWLLRYAPGQGPPRLTRANGRGWTLEAPLPSPAGLDWSKVQACFLGVQGEHLLLSVRRAEGEAGNLYVMTRLADGQWAEPRSLGAKLNTSFDETNPVLASDGKTLYFSSNRDGGRGGYDLWVSRRRSEDWTDWSEPANLGAMINSRRDDLHIAVAAAANYVLVSRTSDNDDNTDLVQLALPAALRPEPTAIISGRCLDQEGKPVSSRVIVQAARPGSQPRMIRTTSAGDYCIIVPADEVVSLRAEQPGYFAQTDLLTQPGYLPEELDYDPANPMASASLNAAYYQRESEINNLRQRLDQVTQELQSTAARRAQVLNTLAARRQAAGWSFTAEDNWNDPELEERYHRYLETAADTLPDSTQWQARGLPPQTELERRSDNLAELEDMKRRFRQYQREQVEDEAVEAAAGEQSRYLWQEEPVDYDALRRSVQEELKAEILPQITQQIGERWVTENPTVADEYSRRRAAEKLKLDITGSLQQPRPTEAVLNDWRAEIKAEMKREMEPTLREILTDELQADIRQALQAETSFQHQQATATALEEEIRNKVLEQIREEEKQSGSGLPSLSRPADTGLNAPPPPAVYSELHRDLRLKTLQAGQVLLLEHIYFAPNVAQFKPESYVELDRLAELLTAKPGLKIEIGSHTNGYLSHAMAMRLSSQRARAIADYLFQKGVNRQQVTHKGYGKSFPIADNASLEGRRQNQRVEMKILTLSGTY